MVSAEPLARPRRGAPSRSVQTFVAGDGVALATTHFGRVDAQPLLFAHGFGQTRNAWDATALEMARRGWHCITADSRGHGQSGRSENGAYTLDQFVDDLAGLARACRQPPVLIGASMGGLSGLLAEAELGPIFRALVLVDITPRWESVGVERILTFMRAHPDGFASIEQASDAIAHYMPHRAGEGRARKSPGRLRQLLEPGADGRLHWHWDPLLLDRITVDSDRYQERLITAAQRIDAPMLLISGASSDVVSDSTIAEFLASAPRARHVRVADATHMVVGDRNDAFTAELGKFLATLATAEGDNRSAS